MHPRETSGYLALHAGLGETPSPSLRRSTSPALRRRPHRPVTKGTDPAVPDTQAAQAAASPPVLSRAEATRRLLLLADLQAALAARDIRSVLARNHRLVLRSERVPCERSGLTDPRLHIFARDGTDSATTDGTTYSLASGTTYTAGDPVAIAALMQNGQTSAGTPCGPISTVRSSADPTSSPAKG